MIKAKKLKDSDIELIIDYYVNKKYNLQSIYRELGFAPTTSRKYLVKNNIEIKDAAYQSSINVKRDRDKYRKHSINKDFFNVWSNNMAYILGFLITDGSVKGNRINLSLQRRDKYILEQIANVVGYTGTVRDGKVHLKVTDKEYLYSELDMTCHEWIEPLSKLQTYANNTFTAKFPNIPNEYMHDFIRGVFDGDGGTKKGRYLRTNFSNGSYNLIKGVADALEELGLSARNIHKSNKNYYYIEYAQKDSLKLYEILYYKNCMHLERKKEIFELYI